MASPLGLTNVSSNAIPQYKVLNGKNVSSIFNNAQFTPFPAIKDKNGNVAGLSSPSTLYNDDMNDTSISSLINYTAGYSAMSLKYADFAYLKDVGVYPNNRIIIARRFPAGVQNDLTTLKVVPLCTLISWVKDGEDYISMKYNEDWEDAEASLTGVLNDIGGNFPKYGGLGNLASAGFNSIPFPGFTEGLQYEVMKKMGITDLGIDNSPLGNPNMIRKAKKRSTLSKDSPGSGLGASITVKMVVEYEMKYVNGIDSSFVYLDIIGNALTFGTSDSRFQFNSQYASAQSGIIADLISGDVVAIQKALQSFIKALIDAVATVSNQLIQGLTTANKNPQEKPSDNSIVSAVQTAFASTIGHVISKYKVRLIGIANALTGAPSTPWHVTIGNPKKPIFCSGDMLCKGVTLTLGKNLGFNDLPSSIKLEFELENARPLGAQELFDRLNTGAGRSYVNLNKSYVDTEDIDFGTYSTNGQPVNGGTYSINSKNYNGVTWLNTSDPYPINPNTTTPVPYLPNP